jgi:polar amino acid transport system substrate-binding protein
MKQLIQILKDGQMDIIEVPLPSISDNNILVKNYYSVISVGTEAKTVKDARLGYIGKAIARQKEVKQVIDSIKTQGFTQTYKMVMNKLDAPSPLGYSCAGEVIAVGKNVKDIRVGDFAACGGAGASHSEYVSVPRNLCVKLNKNTNVKVAAFTTVAAIALQGIRQSDLKLGENCVVIGLGLIGQMTLQFLNAGGIKPIGIDIDGRQVELANKIGIGKSFIRKDTSLEKTIYELTEGYGTDAVIITAASSSTDPVELAGRLCRRKGKVVIVGAVPTGFTREHYYKKELELKMSSSYGPGRYDADYEEKGIDYPIGYVRWTENRNMQAYIDLLDSGKLKMEELITHEFNFEKAHLAYDMILNKEEHFVGVVLKYNVSGELRNERRETDENSSQSTVRSLQKPRTLNYAQITPKVGFIGAGNFAQNFLLPNLKGKCEFISVATSHGHTSKNIAEKYGFSSATGNADEVINNKDVNTVFIATRHNLHAEFVIKALNAGKNVFVEKPLAMNEEELEIINSKFNPPMADKNSKLRIMVGYNRRFAPAIVKMKKELGDVLPKAINYRINSGTIPKGHWIQDELIGGGRIIGEVCHFIDLCMLIAGSRIVSIFADVLETADNLMDTLNISLKFENGGIANISYYSNGNKTLPKEYLEVFSGGQVMIVNDFKELKIFDNEQKTFKMKKQDKGHAAEIENFINAIKNGLPSPISFNELYLSSLASFKVLESIKTRSVIRLSR